MKKESPERLFTRKKSDKDGATKIGHAKRIPIKGVESVGLRQATGLPNHNRSTAKVTDSHAVLLRKGKCGGRVLHPTPGDIEKVVSIDSS